MNEIDFEKLAEKEESEREKLAFISPGMSTDIWSVTYDKSLAHVSDDIRNTLDKFDMAVNPFIASYVSPKDLNGDVSVSSGYDFTDVSYSITSKSDNSSVNYSRNCNSFSFDVSYSDDVYNKTSASHYYKDDKEYFKISDSGLDTLYNLTDSTAIQLNTVHILDSKNIASLNSSLYYAINLASRVTYDNIDKSKSLVLR